MTKTDIPTSADQQTMETITLNGITIQLPVPDANTEYGTGKTVIIDGESIQIPAPANALGRMQAYFADRYGYEKDGSLNPAYKEDPMMRDIFLIMYQLNMATASLEGIAQGTFTSCEHESQYAGGVVSSGNRIYTPQEGAMNALNDMKDESWV
jgi:hypothetical protein